jgi:hypothetical protein
MIGVMRNMMLVCLATATDAQCVIDVVCATYQARCVCLLVLTLMLNARF